MNIPAVRVLDATNSLWLELINQVRHDVYHLPSYVAHAARQEKGHALAIYAEFEGVWILLPLIVRLITTASSRTCSSRFDATSPYGYSSLLTNVDANSSENMKGRFELALQLIINELRCRNVVSLFVRLHPFLPPTPSFLSATGSQVFHGETVVIDLRNSEQEQWGQISGSHRRDIISAAKRGDVSYIDTEWNTFEEFFEIYQQTMRRVSAEPYYFFSRDDFLELKHVLGDQAHLSVVEVDGTVASIGVVTEVDGIVQYHLGGTRDGFLKWSPNKTRVDFVRRWATDRGNQFFHLGGGVGGHRDSLFEFKARFSRLRCPFHTWRVVVNPAEYNELVDDWEKQHLTLGDDETGFFPAYRKLQMRHRIRTAV